MNKKADSVFIYYLLGYCLYHHRIYRPFSSCQCLIVSSGMDKVPLKSKELQASLQPSDIDERLSVGYKQASVTLTRAHFHLVARI